MEEQLIEAMSKLRGGKTKLKELRGRYLAQINIHEAAAEEYKQIVAQIETLTAEEEVDNGKE